MLIYNQERERKMTLLEAIQHDLQNAPTRESIKNNVKFETVTVSAITADDLEEAFVFVEKSIEEV